MPMTFTEEMVDSGLKNAGLDQSGSLSERRERLATYIEQKHGDFVEGWEIRAGRPWTDMNSSEAEQLIDEHPETMGNPGVLSRLNPAAISRLFG